MTINKYLTDDEIKKLQNVKIGVAGCGGLGSNVLNHLVRAGINKFVIVDFDVVSESNLNRQFYFQDQIGLKKVDAISENLKRINPNLEIEKHNCRVEQNNIETLFADCDIILEAFDEVNAKMLIINYFTMKNRKIVAASGMAGWGNSDEIKLRKMGDNLYIVGDMTREVNKDNAPQSARVGIVASKQANTVLALLLDEQI